MSDLGIIITYIAVVVLPIIFWLYFFLRQDRKDPEPRRLLAKVFALSIVAIIVAIVLEGIFDELLLGGIEGEALEKLELSGPETVGIFFLVLFSYFLAGPIEELAKYLILRWSVAKNPHFNQIADGVIYGVTLGLGFAFVENSKYFFDLLNDPEVSKFLLIVVIRGTATTLLHATTAGIIGLYLGRAKFYGKDKKEKAWLVAKGIIIASIIHGFYNIFLFFVFGAIANLCLIILAFVFLFHELRTKESQAIWETGLIKRNKFSG